MALTKIGATLGGSADIITVTQTGHGLLVGRPVRMTDVSGTPTYAYATAAGTATADAIGIIIAQTTDTLTIALGGRITVDDCVPTGDAGTVLFLQVAAGLLAADEPDGNTEVSKPMAVITVDGSEMIMVQQRGEVISTAGISIADGSIDNDAMADNAINTDEIANGAVTLAKIAHTNNSNNGLFLRHNGASSDPTWVAAGGGDLSFGGDTFGADKVIGSNDAYSLSFETAGDVRMKIHGPATNPTSAGAITMPWQPAFLAYRSTDDLTDVTGDGTVYPVDTDPDSNGIAFNTAVFDQGSDYSTSTGKFTAPVTGRYQINTMIRLTGLASNHTVMQLHVVSSNRAYTHRISNVGVGPLGALPTSMAQLIDMDANDNVHIVVSCAGGSKSVDIQGDSAPLTNFSGYLVA